MSKKAGVKFLIAFAASVLVSVSASFGQNPVVHTRSGEISGTLSGTSRVVSFKGIPYAEPPLADLRWKPPGPRETVERRAKRQRIRRKLHAAHPRRDSSLDI